MGKDDVNEVYKASPKAKIIAVNSLRGPSLPER
jgi:hypothetical protein